MVHFLRSKKSTLEGVMIIETAATSLLSEPVSKRAMSSRSFRFLLFSDRGGGEARGLLYGGMEAIV